MARGDTFVGVIMFTWVFGVFATVAMVRIASKVIAKQLVQRTSINSHIYYCDYLSIYISKLHPPRPRLWRTHVSLFQCLRTPHSVCVRSWRR